MAESRQKAHHVLLSTDGKNTALELFDAALWPEKTSNDGEMRVRIDGKWYSPAGKYTFLPPLAVGELVARILSGLELFEDEAPPVALKPPQRVRVSFGECVEGLPVQSQSGHVAAPPFRAVDGRWYVHVFVFGGTRAFPCHDVEPLRR